MTVYELLTLQGSAFLLLYIYLVYRISDCNYDRIRNTEELANQKLKILDLQEEVRLLSGKERIEDPSGWWQCTYYNCEGREIYNPHKWKTYIKGDKREMYEDNELIEPNNNDYNNKILQRHGNTLTIVGSKTPVVDMNPGVGKLVATYKSIPAKFAKGDVVRIVKPKDVREYPMWTTGMDKYDGTIVTVDKIYDNGAIIYHDTYAFGFKWLEVISHNPRR